MPKQMKGRKRSYKKMPGGPSTKGKKMKRKGY